MGTGSERRFTIAVSRGDPERSGQDDPALRDAAEPGLSPRRHLGHTGGVRKPPRSRTETGRVESSTMKKVFTTGQVAKICKVAPRTVSKWFDSGRLRGYRIPGSQDRRIPREHLLRFLKEHGMPLGDLEAEVYHKVLVVGADAPMLGVLKEQLREGDDFRIETAASGFEAGIRAESFHPDCIIIDMAIGRIEAGQIAREPPQEPGPHHDHPCRPDQRRTLRRGLLARVQRRLQEAFRWRLARRTGPPPDLTEEGRRALSRASQSARLAAPIDRGLRERGPSGSS